MKTTCETIDYIQERGRMDGKEKENRARNERLKERRKSEKGRWWETEDE